MKKKSESVRGTISRVLTGEKEAPEEDKTEDGEESSSVEDMLVKKVLAKLGEILSEEGSEDKEEEC